jgi:hypothetical protein
MAQPATLPASDADSARLPQPFAPRPALVSPRQPLLVVAQGDLFVARGRQLEGCLPDDARGLGPALDPLRLPGCCASTFGRQHLPGLFCRRPCPLTPCPLLTSISKEYGGGHDGAIATNGEPDLFVLLPSRSRSFPDRDFLAHPPSFGAQRSGCTFSTRSRSSSP